MKTCRPEYYIPSASTVSRDVRLVFAQSRACIAKMLQEEYEGRLSFETDAWTSPNHYVCVAVTALLEVKGVMIVIVLDMVEAPEVHPCLIAS